MNAPEKIYLRKRNNLPLEVVRDKWYETDPQSLYGSVEYTRTAVFIENACEWFEKNLHIYNTAECMGDRKAFIEDFKNAMKGE